MGLDAVVDVSRVVTEAIEVHWAFSHLAALSLVSSWYTKTGRLSGPTASIGSTFISNTVVALLVLQVTSPHFITNTTAVLPVAWVVTDRAAITGNPSVPRAACI